MLLRPGWMFVLFVFLLVPYRKMMNPYESPSSPDLAKMCPVPLEPGTSRYLDPDPNERLPVVGPSWALGRMGTRRDASVSSRRGSVFPSVFNLVQTNPSILPNHVVGPVWLESDQLWRDPSYHLLPRKSESPTKPFGEQAASPLNKTRVECVRIKEEEHTHITHAHLNLPIIQRLGSQPWTFEASC